MTLTKLARIANVSVSTASKAFSMSSDISELTREEVFAAARANGCFKKLFNEKGIHIPSDIKIISFDNISTSAYSVPSLSSVEFLGKKAAELTVSSVLDILNGGSSEKNHTLSAKLILRESSKIQ